MDSLEVLPYQSIVRQEVTHVDELSSMNSLHQQRRDRVKRHLLAQTCYTARVDHWWVEGDTEAVVIWCKPKSPVTNQQLESVLGLTGEVKIPTCRNEQESSGNQISLSSH